MALLFATATLLPFPTTLFFFSNRGYSHVSFCGHSISSILVEAEVGKLGSSFGWGRAPVVLNGKYLSEMLIQAP